MLNNDFKHRHITMSCLIKKKKKKCRNKGISKQKKLSIKKILFYRYYICCIKTCKI